MFIFLNLIYRLTNDMVRYMIGPRHEKTCLRGGGGWVANNKGADQPAHKRRLISAFVVRFLESIITKLFASEISNF